MKMGKVRVLVVTLSILFLLLLGCNDGGNDGGNDGIDPTCYTLKVVCDGIVVESARVQSHRDMAGSVRFTRCNGAKGRFVFSIKECTLVVAK